MPSKKNIISAIAIVGIAISLYLTYVKLTSSPIRCGFGSCEVVQNSKYSMLFSIPVALYGVLFYFILFYLNYYDKRNALKVWTLVGLLFSIYLTYLELFVILAICLWCVVSAILVLFSAMVSFRI